ncbi:hypothetical protein JVT61DRAFT_8085 [Boletus reticuloceps]|uniref:Uncharacterized protein n=1 Tax=Boletus reticuloceps TaxID=495285 RepID=A0A8I2YK95_9AGAM|nr:hypothetical protein JVT61DRAFT_6363 [Boletus reticuloceps]KAG6380011.1 hypothetical protein JVT61DRAFT_8085 [Boletus reticuloceps]
MYCGAQEGLIRECITPGSLSPINQLLPLVSQPAQATHHDAVQIFILASLHKSTMNMALNSWFHKTHAQPTRFIQKVEMCTALCAGDDTWGTPVDKNHLHTLIRVFLVPTATSSDASKDTLLIERVLSTGGAFHSVAPIPGTLSSGGTLLHPDVHERVCVIEGPSATFARGLVVQRTLTFGDRALTLAQFAQILEFVSRTAKLVCDGGDCTYQSRSFAFMCLSAMAPIIPPRKRAEESASKASFGSEPVDDSVFELAAEAFLAQVSLLFRDAASMQTVSRLSVEVTR